MEAKDIAATIANSLFLPVNANYDNYLALPLRIFVVCFFFYSCVIAAPPVIDLVINHDVYLPLVSEALESKETATDWLVYIGFLCEICFFLMIGGSVFSEWIAANSKETITKLEVALHAARKNEIGKARDDLETEIARYDLLLSGITIRNLIPRLIDMYKSSKRVMNLVVQDVPRINARFLATNLAVAFPGGAYGVCAFLLFGGLIQIRIAQMYLKYVS